MSHVYLSKKGIKKMTTYLESIAPALKGKIEIMNGFFRISGVDFLVRVPIIEDLPISTQAQTTDVSTVAPGSEPVGKAPQSNVKSVGRAGEQKRNEQELRDLGDRLSKIFPTRVELDKYLQKLERKQDTTKELSNAFGQIAQSLSKR